MSSSYLGEYFPVLLFMAAAFAVSLAALGLSFALSPKKPYAEKSSPYECGMEPFGDARGKARVRFYLVAILFVIFGIEVAFLFPWAVALADTGLDGFWSMMLFLAVQAVGFAYEWKKGALEWE
jgi:NADH-quinone oxidoreductase subunit A